MQSVIRLQILGIQLISDEFRVYSQQRQCNCECWWRHTRWAGTINKKYACYSFQNSLESVYEIIPLYNMDTFCYHVDSTFMYTKTNVKSVK